MRIDTEVNKTVQKIVKGGKEYQLIDNLAWIHQFWVSDASVEEFFEQEVVAKYSKIYGKSCFTKPKEYFSILRFKLRGELAAKHTLLETYRIYIALEMIGCSLIRVSKNSPNYQNVKIVRKLANIDSYPGFPYNLFEPLNLIDKSIN